MFPFTNKIPINDLILQWMLNHINLPTDITDEWK